MTKPRWRISAPEVLLRNPIYAVRRHTVSRDGGAEREIHTLETSCDWCNVVPLCDDGRIVLVRQHRFGTDAPSLEIPGGLIDPGETPLEAARRELEEETGYVAASIETLGVVRPNPALQATRLHMHLARGCVPHGRGQHLEELEDCEVVLLDRAGLEAALDAGEIHHALVHAALFAFLRAEQKSAAATR
jgi:8-oxo-dGTP pyrophosphatase MutT (NUDIX family)